MSLILEALRRSENEREARASSPPVDPSQFEGEQRRRLWPWLFAGFLILNAAGFVAYSRLGGNPGPKPDAPEIPLKAKPQARAKAPEAPPQAFKPKPKIKEKTAVAEAYLGRGWAQEDMGNHESAARNFTKAIEIDAKMAEAYFGLGWVSEKRGQPEQAIKDYDRAVRFRPGYIDAYFSRGILNFYGGHMAAAVDDFTAVLKKADGALRHYAFLWLYISRARQGDSPVRRSGPVRAADMKIWPGVIVSYYQGRRSAADVLKAAKDAEPQRQKEKESVAFFFLGQYKLLQGDEDGAADYFRKTVAVGVTTFRQYGAARRELRALGLL